MSQIIMSVGSQKGGTGKSTVVRATAKVANEDGLKVKIADLDVQQGTTWEWHRLRMSYGHPQIAEIELIRTAQQALRNNLSETDLLIIDGPARASEQTLQIAKISDIFIQPTGPSLDDLIPAVKLFHELTKKKIPKERLVMVINRCGTSSEFYEAYQYVKDAGYNVLKEFLFEKPTYRQSQNTGLTILETRYKHLNDAAKKVITSFINIMYKN